MSNIKLVVFCLVLFGLGVVCIHLRENGSYESFESKDSKMILSAPVSIEGVDRISLEQTLLPKQSSEWPVSKHIFQSDDVRPVDPNIMPGHCLL